MSSAIFERHDRQNSQFVKIGANYTATTNASDLHLPSSSPTYYKDFGTYTSEGPFWSRLLYCS